jgi:thiol:disulfide interchange protein DsbA
MFEWSKKVLIIMMLLPLALSQVEAQEYEAGIDYEVLPQAIRTANPNKIEVNEVFHYLCIHCYNFEGTIHPWADKLPSDVDFQRTPAIWQTALGAVRPSLLHG